MIEIGVSSRAFASVAFQSLETAEAYHLACIHDDHEGPGRSVPRVGAD